MHLNLKLKFTELDVNENYKEGIFRSIETSYERRFLVELVELEKFIFLSGGLNV